MSPLNYSSIIAIVSLVPLLAHSAWGQQHETVMGKQSDACSKITGEHFNIATHYRAIRTIEDPATHQFWILLRNLGRPSAPALLIQGSENVSREGTGWKKSGSSSVPDYPNFVPAVIHAGDSLIVSERTSVLDADLEATALREAAIGNRLTVRLKLGGRTLSVIATGPGRASLEEGNEVRR
jgi:hypothetical protein